MNSIHRVGLTIATLAAVATIAGALVVQGYMSAEQALAQAATRNVAQATAQPTATRAPQIVYVTAPLPVPPPTAAPAQQPAIVHLIVPSAYGDDGGTDQ